MGLLPNIHKIISTLYIEIPGVYVQPDKSYLCVIDNIEGTIINDSSEKLKIKLSNPTKATAKVKLFSELSDDCVKPLQENALWNCMVVTLQPGENKILEFKKHP